MSSGGHRQESPLPRVVSHSAPTTPRRNAPPSRAPASSRSPPADGKALQFDELAVEESSDEDREQVLGPQRPVSSERAKRRSSPSKAASRLDRRIMPIRLAAFDAECEREMTQFRKRIAGIPGIPTEYQGASGYYRHLRFVRRGLSVDKSVSNFTRCVKIRTENEAVSRAEKALAAATPTARNGQTTFSHAKQVTPYFPTHLHFCNDVYGRPVCLVRMRDFDIKGLMEHATEEQYFEYELYRWEHMDTYLRALSKELGILAQWVVVVDMKGYSSNLFSKKALTYLRKPHYILNKIHKELLGPIVVVNAPTWFKALWLVAKYFVTARTRRKLYVLGSDCMATLRSLLGSEAVTRLLKSERKARTGAT